MSPPSRRRGLKFISKFLFIQRDNVASFAEAWIEIKVGKYLSINLAVASFAEAWIEI